MPAVTDDITAILTTYLARMHGILDTGPTRRELISTLVDDGLRQPHGAKGIF